MLRTSHRPFLRAVSVCATPAAVLKCARAKPKEAATFLGYATAVVGIAPSGIDLAKITGRGGGRLAQPARPLFVSGWARGADRRLCAAALL